MSLKQGRDWHGWAWKCEDDDLKKLFHWAEPRKPAANARRPTIQGRWVRVKFVEVECDVAGEYEHRIAMLEAALKQAKQELGAADAYSQELFAMLAHDKQRAERLVYWHRPVPAVRECGEGEGAV